MARYAAEDLRSLADVLDGLKVLEEETGVPLEGRGGNTLTIDGRSVHFGRVVSHPDAELDHYYVEIGDDD